MAVTPLVNFMVGTGRCGSTVVHESLCRHPAIGFVSNLEDRSSRFRRYARWNGPVYRALPDAWTRKGRLRFAPSEAYHALDREVSPLLGEPYRDPRPIDATAVLERRLRAFFLDRPNDPAATTLLHKFTGWPRVQLLARVFPDAKYVHVVRDGRAVASSWLQMPWWRGHLGPEGWHFGPLPADYATEWAEHDHSLVVLAGLAWKMLLDAHADAEAEVGPDKWLNIRYEQFAENPANVLEECLDFLGVPATAAFTARVERLAIDAGRRDAFTEDLGPEATATLTRVLRSHLDRWGFAD